VAVLASRRLAVYAVLALPLAMAALPVYVHAPKLYAGLGLSLALIGTLLLGIRVLDAVSDPLLGLIADRVSRRVMIAVSVLPLAAGTVLLFNPPAASDWLVAWFAGALVLVYLGLSAASIGYLAMGSALSRDYHERTRVTALRGAVSLAGVLLAATLPDVLGAEAGDPDGLARFSLIFVPLLLAAAAITLGAAPAASRPGGEPLRLRALWQPLANPRFRRLALVFLVNGVAAAIPATLILFYVADVLARPQLAGIFLAIYFISGAAGMPLWLRLSRVMGKAGAWVVAMGLSVAAFVWAFVLGEGDVAAFSAVCALSGLAFGADLALPASLLADVIDDDSRAATSRPDGAYFGLWHFLEKLALALAAGIALPLLDVAGYQPGTPAATTTLAAVYALLPCVIKLAAAGLLWAAALESRRVPAIVFAKGEPT